MTLFSKSPLKERRGAQRHTEPRLETYYWNGAAASPRSVRDISSSGTYLLTEERWSPGTVLIVTLQSTDASADPDLPRSIAVQSKVVRCGTDGVGFMFIFPASIEFSGWDEYVHGVDRKTFDAFMGWNPSNLGGLIGRYARLPLRKVWVLKPQAPGRISEK